LTLNRVVMGEHSEDGLGTKPEDDKDGKLIGDAINNSLSNLNPDLMFEKLVEDYSTAKQIYGEKLLREITGADENYLEHNLQIPEYQRELKSTIEQRIKQLKKKGLVNKDDAITDKAIELASMILYTEELDKISNMGQKELKKISFHGDKKDLKPYTKSDRYRDISVRKTVKVAIQRQRKNLTKDEIRVHSRHSKGEIYIVYGLDASGSMKGEKISNCKKAGVALAYNAIEKKDRVGIIVFGQEPKEIMPTNDFAMLLREITTIRAASITDIAGTIKKSVDMFPKTDVTKHLVLITDAMPTTGDDPEQATLEAVSQARAAGITVSLVGIELEAGRELGEQIAELGGGRLYLASSSEDVDIMVLEDYSHVSENRR